MHSNNRHPVTTSRGFGLVEMLVSITIITIVTSVVIARHNSFNGSVLLRNQAYDIAFDIRQTQLLAVSGTTPMTDVVQQYGVYFSRSTPNTYLVYRDDNGNGIYDSGSDTQIGATRRIDPKFAIGNIFYNNTTSVGIGAGNNLSISFRRPNFDALFRRSVGTYVNSGSAYIDIVRVDGSGTGAGTVRRVEITPTGQVRVVTY